MPLPIEGFKQRGVHLLNEGERGSRDEEQAKGRVFME